MKKWHSISLSLILFFALNNICKTLTGDFSIDYLIQPAPENSKWKNEQEPDNLQHILTQKFSYLGKGKQAHVFLSEDKEHVLKVFKPIFPHFQYHLFGKTHKLSFSKMPGVQALFQKIYATKIAEQREKDFQSYVNCFTLFPEETKIEYLHLATTSHLQCKVALFDKIGVMYSLDADHSCFLIQKKADLLYPTLLSYIQEERLEEAKQLISSFVSLSSKFVSYGIDKPTTVEKNLGRIGFQVIQIDVGRVLQKKESCKAEELDYCIHHMKKWLFSHSLPLHAYLENLIQVQKESL